MCLAGGSNSEKACAERAHQRNSKDGMGGLPILLSLVGLKVTVRI